MPDLVREFVGHEQLVPAIDTVSHTNGPDVAVVRGFVQDAALLDRLNDMDADYDEVRQELHDAVPSLAAAGEFVVRRWQQIGYAGMQASPDVFVGSLLKKGIMPHVDNVSLGSVLVNAIVQGTLCLTGTREFRAERLPVNFYRNTTDEHDGGFDLDAFNAFNDVQGDLVRSILERERQPRSSVVLQPGDLALFAHHPSIVLHSSEHLVEAASARLLAWSAMEPGW